MRDLSSHARRVVAWGARGVRVGEAQNPGPDDTLELTQLDGGPHSPEESGAPGLTVRQESDTESVASVNRDNEATVPAPVDQLVGSRRTRRLVLVGANPPPEEVDLTVADSPSESGDSSAVEAEDVPHDNQIPQNSRRDFELNRRALTAGLECLDQVELHNVFRTRASVMKNVPFMMKGVFRVALTTAMGEVLRGHDDGDELRKERGWKMLMLLPRMLLARPRGGRISQRKLQARITMFTTGRWHLLMEVSNECARAGVEAKVRASRRSGRDDIKSRVRRAETLVHLGELSAGRQALDGAEVAPGNLATLAQLTNPERRPPVPRDPLSGSATAVPERPFELDPVLFCRNVRSARRGAAPGPSGMSVEHILGLVESDHDMDIFCSFATIVSQGHVPRGVLEGLRMGRVTALRKPDGGIRGIVVGDIVSPTHGMQHPRPKIHLSGKTFSSNPRSICLCASCVICGVRSCFAAV